MPTFELTILVNVSSFGHCNVSDDSATRHVVSSFVRRCRCIGMTWNEARDRCPEGVVPACHNSADTVTVSGPADSVAKFVAQLQKEGVFAKAVDSSGVAFHSYYMSQAAPALKQRLQQVCFAAVPNPILMRRCFLLSYHSCMIAIHVHGHEERHLAPITSSLLEQTLKLLYRSFADL